MEKKDRPLTPLKDIISSLLSDSRLPFNPGDALIWKVWDEAVGPTIARHAQPLWIKGGRLRVQVSDPIWLQELSFLKESIKEKINGKIGRASVEQIEFRIHSE